MIKVEKNGEVREVPNKVFANFMQHDGWVEVDENDNKNFKEMMQMVEDEDDPAVRLQYLAILKEIRNTQKVKRLTEQALKELEDFKLKTQDNAEEE